MNLSFESDTYPYERVFPDYNRMNEADKIFYEIATYLLDLPDQNGYMPKDDNSRPRVRIAKYLWYDGENPLTQELPTPQEKLSMLFDAGQPVINDDEAKKEHPKGYRLYVQPNFGQSQLDANTTIKVYSGRVIPVSPFKFKIGIYFDILCNVNLETNIRTDSYNRSYDIMCALISALHGVNITGIGTVSFDKVEHPDNGSRPIWDESTNYGQRLHMSIDWMESSPL